MRDELENRERVRRDKEIRSEADGIRLGIERDTLTG
jgi:hypothetical protein